MNIIADTDVLVRLVIADDVVQSGIAIETMRSAEAVTISIHAFCEMAWVLKRRYAIPRSEIASTIRGLIETHNVVVNRPVVEAGLTMMDAGGDFADGVIAYDGKWLGGETFVSFDKKAVALLAKQGQLAKLLA